ncbi:MAG: FeoA family protein [Longibaculum sp.]
MTLDEIQPGHTVVIESVGGQGLLRRRLLEMGLTPKTKIKVRKVAPMGDPIEVYLRSYVLTLRKDDASKIEVKEVEDE